MSLDELDADVIHPHDDLWLMVLPVCFFNYLKLLLEFQL